MNRMLVMALVAVIVGLVVGLLVVESGNDEQPSVTLQAPNTVVRTVTSPSATTPSAQTEPSPTPDGTPPPDGDDGGSGGIEAP